MRGWHLAKSECARWPRRPPAACRVTGNAGRSAGWSPARHRRARVPDDGPAGRAPPALLAEGGPAAALRRLRAPRRSRRRRARRCSGTLTATEILSPRAPRTSSAKPARCTYRDDAQMAKDAACSSCAVATAMEVLDAPRCRPRARRLARHTAIYLPDHGSCVNPTRLTDRRPGIRRRAARSA